MKKLNSMPDYTAKMPKQPHDVSQSTGFTAPVGQISPLYYDMLHTGDEIHFSASCFARLNPLVTAALGDIEVHADYFFVPLSVLYTPITSMFYQTDDLISSSIDKNQLYSTTDFPTFDPADSASSGSWWEWYDSQRSVHPERALSHSIFDCFGKSVFRMWDFLDMQPYSLFYQAEDNTLRSNYPAFTPWFALAYQAIYQLYPQYRNSDRESKQMIFQLDKWYSTGKIIDALGDSPDPHKSIFCMRYANRHKDYFNSVKVSPMGSAVSMLSDPGTVFNSVNDWLYNKTFDTIDNNFTLQSFANSVNLKPRGQSADTIFSPVGIRQIFMVDKLLRIIGRSEKNYESQFLAHYGVKIPHDDLHNITHIGHDMAVLSPSPVISQADTFNGDTGSALGEVGGQGSVMLSGNKYSFKAPFHGVFMCNITFIPRTRYLVGMNKLHQLNSINDFWQPEFDKKGMQPIFGYEIEAYNAFGSNRLGWQFAYEQFKRKADRITFAFAPSASDSNVNTYSPWFITQLPYRSLSRSGLAAPSVFGSLYWEDFKVSVTDLNGIMQVPYDPDWSASYLTAPWLVYQTDPFICDFHIYCKKVNAMSEYGEPEL